MRPSRHPDGACRRVHRARSRRWSSSIALGGPRGREGRRPGGRQGRDGRRRSIAGGRARRRTRCWRAPSAMPEPTVLVEEILRAPRCRRSRCATAHGGPVRAEPGLQADRRRRCRPEHGGMGAYSPLPSLRADEERDLVADRGSDVRGDGTRGRVYPRAPLRGPDADGRRPEGGRVQLSVRRSRRPRPWCPVSGPTWPSCSSPARRTGSPT